LEIGIQGIEDFRCMVMISKIRGEISVSSPIKEVPHTVQNENVPQRQSASNRDSRPAAMSRSRPTAASRKAHIVLAIPALKLSSIEEHRSSNEPETRRRNGLQWNPLAPVVIPSITPRSSPLPSFLPAPSSHHQRRAPHRPPGHTNSVHGDE
jgi:hypothetical protein